MSVGRVTSGLLVVPANPIPFAIACMIASYLSGGSIRNAARTAISPSPRKAITMCDVDTPSAPSDPTDSTVSTFDNGGSTGVCAIVAGPLAGTTSACLSRVTDTSIAHGATSAVVSSHTGLPAIVARVIRWLNDAGDGTASLNRTPAPISTASDWIPAAASIAANSVCLSLQSPYWFESISAAVWGW